MKKVKYKEGNKAVIYARFSSSKQQEQSIEAQVRVCTEWADREGYTVVKVYADRAVTGTDTARPQLHQMLTDIAEGTVDVDVVLVYKRDRLNRSQLDALLLMQELGGYGVRVMSATEVNAEGATGVLTTGLDLLIAEHYSVELSEKTQRGMYQSVLNGTSTGAPAPLGYKWVNKRLVVDDAKKDCIPLIFNMYAEGKSKTEIADYLNNQGYTNRKGKPFKMSDFENLLKNRKYVGEWWYKGEMVQEHGNEPLVDVETFEKVQQMLQYKRKYGAANKAKQRTYALAGRCYCGDCGGKMTASGGRGRNGNYYYYRCNACKINIRQDEIEDYVYKQTLSTFALQEGGETIEKLADSILSAYAKDSTSTVADSRQVELQATQKQLDGLVTAIADNPAIAGALTAKILELQEKEKVIRVAIEAEEKSRKKVQHNRVEMIQWLGKFLQGDAGTAPVEDILHYFVRMVVIFNGADTKECGIVWNVSADAATITVDDVIRAFKGEGTDGLTKPQNENNPTVQDDGVIKGFGSPITLITPPITLLQAGCVGRLLSIA